jgi:hypothetical protein
MLNTSQFGSVDVALQLDALRDALVDAGASQASAAKAAEEVAGYDNRIAAIDTRLAVLMVMVGGLYVIGAPAVWLIVRVAFKVGALG